jgi:EmrB/QacA subfamily drug resistance transporter
MLDLNPTENATVSSLTPTKGEIHRVFAGLCLAMFLSALDQTIVAAALPTIGLDLGGLAQSSWIVTSYLVAATVATPLYGKLADIHGGRIMLLIAVGVFVLGSAACAVAPNMTALACARTLQGLGGGGLMSLAQTIIADLVSPRERGRYQPYFALVFVTSSVAGPVLGGFLAQHAHWSMIFWINLPLGLLALLIVDRSLKRLPIRRHPHELDYIGAGLLAAASGLLALALGQRAAALRDMLGIALLSAMFWALFVHRLRNVDEPFIPLSVLANATARNAALCGALGLGSFVGLSVVAPVYFESAFALDADLSGLALIAPMVGTVAGATISGRLMPLISRYKTPGLVGLAVAAAASLFAAARIDGMSLPAFDLVLTIISLGSGAILPISTVSLQNAVESRNLGAATAAMQFARQIGCALIVALLGALAMGAGAVALQSDTLDPAALADLHLAFRNVFLANAACLVVSLIFLARMEERPLRATVGQH